MHDFSVLVTIGSHAWLHLFPPKCVCTCVIPKVHDALFTTADLVLCTRYPKVQPIEFPLYTCRSPLPHGADQGPDSSGASGGTVGQAGTTPGPV